MKLHWTHLTHALTHHRPLLLGTGLLLSAIVPLLALLPSTSATSQTPKQQDAGVRVELERERLNLIAYGTTTTLTPDDFQVRVLDAVNCDVLRREPEQRLAGRWFFDSVAVDPQTGNVAVGVLLEECVETQVSAVFVIDPQPGAYALYRISVPGDRPLPDEFSTFPLDGISHLAYLGDQLLIQQGDASGSGALLVFSTDEHPAGRYRGCVVTRTGEGPGLCPPDDAILLPTQYNR